MSNPVFPYSDKQDSQHFGIKPEDPAMVTQMEGGYVVSRRRHTRLPRRTWTSGFTNLSDAQRATLEAFWDTVGGGSVIFDWRHPVDHQTYAVRFVGGLSFSYVGIGGNHLWNLTFSVEQA